MAYGSQPTMKTRLLGAKLRRARVKASITIDDVAARLRCTPASLYRRESGHTAVKPSELDFYINLYQVDREEAARWREWSLRSMDRTWTRAGAALGPTYRDYADAESLADEVRTWQPQMVPGLLQTVSYSEAVMRENNRLPKGTVADDLLAVRERRKSGAFTREVPLRLAVIIGEAAVRTAFGSPSEMAAQIQHLLNLGETTAAALQILLCSSGSHPAASGPFDILSYGRDDIVFREGYGDGGFTEDHDQVRKYRAIYELLAGQALSPAKSRQYLHQVLSDLETAP